MQLQQRALDTIRVFVDVFQKQEPALDAGEVFGSEQRTQHAQVAAPKFAANRQAVETGVGAKAHRFELTAHRFEKTILRHVVDAAVFVAAPEVVAGQWPGPGDAVGMREQTELQRREIAVANPARAAFDTAGDPLPVDLVEQARQPIPAAGGQRDARRLLGHAVQRGQPGRVVTGETLVLEPRGRVFADLETQRREAPRRAFQGQSVGQHAGRCEERQCRHGVSVGSNGGVSNSVTSPAGMASGSFALGCARR